MKKVLISDPTLRDGNHAVAHQVTEENIATYCKAANAAGIPVVEVGHGNGLGASSILIGKAKVPDETMLSIARENLKTTRLGVLAVPGFCTIKADLTRAIALGVDVFRIASHCTEADITQRHIEFVRNAGRSAYGVLLMSHMADTAKLVEEAKKMASYGAEAIIIFDSSGHYLPENVTERIAGLANQLDIPVGFHGHNNLGMGIMNSVAAVRAGAGIIEGTIRGFGAGAGNAQLEVLVAVFQRLGWETGIDLYKVLDLAQLAERTFNPVAVTINPLAIVSGLAGVFSGFSRHVAKAARDFGVDPRDVFFELGKRNAVAGQEAMILEVAQDLAKRGLVWQETR